jgi:hypothetical protein
MFFTDLDYTLAKKDYVQFLMNKYDLIKGKDFAREQLQYDHLAILCYRFHKWSFKCLLFPSPLQ